MILKKDTPIVIAFILFLFSANLACGQEESSQIAITLYPESILVDQKEVKEPEVETHLKTIVSNKSKEGITTKSIAIRLRVHQQTKRGKVADLETTLRKLNLKKVVYSAFE